MFSFAQFDSVKTWLDDQGLHREKYTNLPSRRCLPEVAPQRHRSLMKTDVLLLKKLNNVLVQFLMYIS